MDQGRVDNWLQNRTGQMFYDTKQAADASERALRANAETFGKSTAEVARVNEAVRLENELQPNERFGPQ